MSLQSDNISSCEVPGKIWGLVIDSSRRKMLYLDTRKNKPSLRCVLCLDTDSMEFETILEESGEDMKKLLSHQSDSLFFVSYLDQSDPSQQQMLKYDLAVKQWSEIPEAPILVQELLRYPVTYEHQSEWHSRVKDFLGLDLPLACEYLETKNCIIISYYLRSDSGFERFLLVIQDGKKKVKVVQDTAMKGFSPDAFFVLHDQIIFIKNENEVCVIDI